MTKRRWLKTAIEESKKPQIALPWSREAATLSPELLAAAPAKEANPAHA